MNGQAIVQSSCLEQVIFRANYLFKSAVKYSVFGKKINYQSVKINIIEKNSHKSIDFRHGFALARVFAM
jgi:hypothetical protein